MARRHTRICVRLHALVGALAFAASLGERSAAGAFGAPETALTLSSSVGAFHCAVADLEAGFGYFGTYSQVVKVRLSDLAVVSVLPLAAGETSLRSAVIDNSAGYAYFGTGTAPARIVKIRLSDFSRVGALSLTSSEGTAASAAIDVPGGFAYFGTTASPGRVLKIRLTDFTRVSTLTLQTGEDNLHAAVHDPTTGDLYFGTYYTGRAGIVVKVRTSDFTRVGALTLATNEYGMLGAVIDPAAGFAYFTTSVAAAAVVKIQLSDFTRVGAVEFSSVGEGSPRAAVIDPAADRAYFTGRWTDFGGTLTEVRLSDFTRLGNVVLPDAEINLWSAVIDPVRRFAYLASDTSPGHLVKVHLPSLTRVQGVATSGDDKLSCLLVDPSAGYAYAGTSTSPPHLVRVRLTDFTRAGTLELDPSDTWVGSGVIDPVGGFAYFSGSDALYTWSGKLIKIRLSDFTRVGAAVISEKLDVGVLDAASGFVYFGNSNGQIVKIRVSDLTRIGVLTFPGDQFASAVIDLAAGYAYFGVSNTSPGRVERIRLSDFTSAGSLTLAAGETGLRSAVIDPAAGFAYFGTLESGSYGTPASVVKISLPDYSRVGALTLQSGETDLRTAVIDPPGRFAYFGSGSAPLRIVAVSLSDFTRAGALTFASGSALNAGFDPTAGFGYWASSSFSSPPSKVYRVDLGAGIGTTTVLSTSENPVPAGNPVTLTAVVAPTSGTGTPAGSAQFRSDGADLGAPVALSGGVAALTTSTLPAGSHAITAAYSGDGTYRASLGGLPDRQLVLCAGAPTATVSGSLVSCEGVAAQIPVTLTGTPPWSLVWSDGFAQSGISSSPGARTLDTVRGTRTYSVRSVSDASCVGNTTGTFTLDVYPDVVRPVVTAPADVVVDQSVCCTTVGGTAGGATAGADPLLAAFVAAGNAADECSSALRLPVQAGGNDVTNATCFAPGTTAATFRFQDAVGNIGVASANVTVRMFGDLNLDLTIDPSDMVVLRAYFNFAISPGIPPFAAPLETADLTHEGNVDPADMVMLRAYFNFAVGCLAP